MNDKRQLLCTFSSATSFKLTIEEIKKFYTVCNDCFFVFSNDNVSKEVFITYNILSQGKEFPKFPNTISIHRKKQTNTLYTLNAMNRLIEEENGHADKTFIVNWKLYENSLIITGDVSIRVIPLKITSIVE